ELRELGAWSATLQPGTQPVSLRARLEPVARTWTGRRAPTWRRVLFDGILPLVGRAKTRTLPLPVRSVALLARVSLGTAARALHGLERECGVLVPVRRHAFGSSAASVYRVHAPVVPAVSCVTHVS